MLSKDHMLLCLSVWVFHLINTCTRNSYHDPDEYWQSMEIAHAKSFGYGYITWEWRYHIRSTLFVWIWVFMYWTLRYFQLDDKTWVMHFAPKLIMSIFAAASDVVLFFFIKRISGNTLAYYTLVASLFNVFNMVYSTRTLSNSIEMILNTFGIVYWPYHTATIPSTKSMTICLCIIALACMIRPSNILFWIVPYILLLQRLWTDKHKLSQVISLSCALSIMFLSFQTLIDTIFYNDISPYSSVIFTPYHFLKRNIIDGISQHYGMMPWYWYISHAMPFLLTTWAPFLIYGSFFILPIPNLSRFLIIFSSFGILFNSFISHKEFRFIHPLLPVLTPLIGHGLMKWMNGTRFPRKLLLITMLIFNSSVALFLNRYHNCGIIPTMDHVATMIESNSNNSFIFLMPCHSTPWISYLHNPSINISMLTCDYLPGPNQYDETTAFYSNPNGLLESRIKGYDYIVLFECLLKNISSTLRKLQNRTELKIVWRRFNSFFHPDSNRDGDILIIENE